MSHPDQRRRVLVLLGISVLGFTVLLVALLLGPGDSPGPSTTRVGPSMRVPSSPQRTTLRGLDQVPVTPADGLTSADVPACVVRVFSEGNPVAGAVVQILQVPRDKPASVLKQPVRTDSEGYARFGLPNDRVPSDTYVEAAQLKTWGYARVLEPIAPRALLSEQVQEVHLSTGGTLEFDLTSLPPEARPGSVDLRVFPAGEAHRNIVPAVPLQVPEVGLSQLFPEHLSSVPVQESGLTIPIEVPADHVVSPEITPSEPGWMMVSQGYTGRSVGSDPFIPVLAVRAGVDETYESRWTRLPSLHVRILDAQTGSPLPQGEVRIGLRPDGGRSRIHTRLYAADLQGEIHTRLTLGPFQPQWSLLDAAVVIVAAAPGHRTQVALLPFQWDAIRADMRLHPDSGLTWSIRGRVSWKDGTIAAGNQLVISPVSLHRVQFPVKTDAEGRFEIELDESNAPLFFEGGWGLAAIRRLPHEWLEGGTWFKIGFGAELNEAVISIPKDPSTLDDLVLVLDRQPK